MKRVYEAASFSLLMLLIFTTFICGLNYGKIKKLQDGQVVLAAAVKELQKGSKSLGAERYVELVKRGANLRFAESALQRWTGTTFWRRLFS